MGTYVAPTQVAQSALQWFLSRCIVQDTESITLRGGLGKKRGGGGCWLGWNMNCPENYKQTVYFMQGGPGVIVLLSCYQPKKQRKDLGTMP